MPDPDDNGFKISFDDEERELLYPQSAPKAEPGDDRIAKVNRRVTWQALLLPCLFAVMLLGAWLALETKMSNSNLVGTQEVTDLAQDLDSRFSSLSVRQAKLEKAFAEAERDAEQRMGAIQAQLAQLQENQAALQTELTALAESNTRLAEILDLSQQAAYRAMEEVARMATDQIRTQVAGDLAQKIDRADANRLVASFQSEVLPLSEKLDTMAGQVASLDHNLTQDLKVLEGKLENTQKDISNLTNRLQTDMARLDSQVNAAGSQAVDDDYVAAMVRKEMTLHKLRLETINQELNQRLSVLENQIRQLSRPGAIRPPDNQTGLASPPSLLDAGNGLIEQDIQ